MQNSGTQQNTGRQAGKGQAIPPDEQAGSRDMQSEFSVNESRREAAQEENAQRQQNAASDEEQSNQAPTSADVDDTQSEFAVERRLREDEN